MISKELLSELGYGKVTYICDVTELYNMQCLMFKCDVTRDSERWLGKTITTSETYYIALEVLANKCKSWLELETEYEVVIIENKVYFLGDIWTEGEVWCEKEWRDKLTWIENVFEACQWVLEKNKDIK